MGRDRRRLLLVDEPARDHLSRLNDIPADWGTAVNVQAMVFGNMGEDSATGVAFTRNPSTGENALYGEFLVNAQGEDVVAGIRTPQNITERRAQGGGLRQALARGADAGGVQAVRRHDETPRETLQGHAGHRVHRRARQALDAADPQRQADGQRRAPDRGGHGQRRPDLARGRDHPRRARGARPTPASDPRSEGEARADRDRTARLARRRQRRRSCSPPTTPKPRGKAGRKTILVRVETTPGGHPRHARRRRHRHDARRHDLACGGRRARHGQALRGRAPARSASTTPSRR